MDYKKKAIEKAKFVIFQNINVVIAEIKNAKLDNSMKTHLINKLLSHGIQDCSEQEIYYILKSCKKTFKWFQTKRYFSDGEIDEFKIDFICFEIVSLNRKEIIVKTTTLYLKKMYSSNVIRMVSKSGLPNMTGNKFSKGQFLHCGVDLKNYKIENNVLYLYEYFYIDKEDLQILKKFKDGNRANVRDVFLCFSVL